MKFATSVITLVAATSAVYSSPVLFKRYEALSPECSSQWNTYRDCMSIPDDGLGKDALCKLVTSENCKNFYANAENLLSACGDSTQILRRIFPENLAQIQNTNTQYCNGNANADNNNAGNNAGNNNAGNNNNNDNNGNNNGNNAGNNNTKPANKPANNNGNNNANAANSNTNTANNANTNTGNTNTANTNTGAAPSTTTTGNAGVGSGTLSNVNTNSTAGNNQPIDMNSGASTTKIFTSLFVTLGLLMFSL